MKTQNPIVLWFNAHNLYPETEYQFDQRRKWRFDYCWPVDMVALEVEGGIWTNGRHTRGKGFLGDMEKYNAATLQGWRVFRTTPDRLCTEETLTMIRRAIDKREVSNE